MRMGMGTDFGGTITATGGPSSPVPCCTAAQASSPAYTNTDDGNLRYSSTATGVTYCNPNCMDEFTYDTSILGSISSSQTQKMILIAAAVGVLVLVLAKK